MKKATALLTLLSLLFLLSPGTAAGHVVRSAQLLNLAGLGRIQAPAQAAAAGPQWKSREEYDAFNAMATEKDPNRKISLAEAFLQKYANSDFKDQAYLVEMQTYQQMSQMDLALDAGRRSLQANPDNLPALRFLSFTFPFLYKPGQAGATSALSRAGRDARHGLEVLQKLQKPAGATDEQFQTTVKDFRSVFNSCTGFVALQKKDYPNAVTALKAAVADKPSDVFGFYRLGVAYLFSTPADYDHGIWYLARAAGLSRTSKNPYSQDLIRYYRNVFVQTLGSDAGEEDTITQALASVNPPDGLDRGGAPRGGLRPGPSGSASASHKPNPSGPPVTGQTSNVTVNRVYASIYPTWLPPSENESGDQVPPPPPAEPDDQIAAQLYNPAGEMSMVGQEQPGQYARAPFPPEPPEPEPAPPATVLVYKDGHQVEVENYAIVGENLVWFSGPLSKKIPLADLDLRATRKVNEDHGITFGAPDAP